MISKGWLAMVLATLSTVALAQTITSTAAITTYTGKIGMCNQPIDNANASGLYTFAVDYPLNVPSKDGQNIVNIPDPS